MLHVLMRVSVTVQHVHTCTSPYTGTTCETGCREEAGGSLVVASLSHMRGCFKFVFLLHHNLPRMLLASGRYLCDVIRQ
jgi:hypothetical protein